MLTQAADSLARWSAGAIHDTVGVIVGQDVYQRRLARSLAERFWAWLWDQMSALFSAVAGTPTARMVTLIACGLLVIAVALRILLAARAERFATRTITGVTGRAARHVSSLDDARRLAREARYADAIHVLYGATLDALAQRRLIRLHASKTSGDFARELNARGHTVHDPFRAFARRFDRLFYGYDACDRAAFDALWGDAERVLSAAGVGPTP